jgi:hypothetical protein
MATFSLREKLRRSVYWTRSVAQHEPAHIVADQSRGGITRYFLACGNSVTGGLTCVYQRVETLSAHVCVGCVKAVS